MMNSVTFLLGAGVSEAAGIDSTLSLTAKILSDENFAYLAERHDITRERVDSVRVRAHTPHWPWDIDISDKRYHIVPLAGRASRWMAGVLAEYYLSMNRYSLVNYEDVFDLADHIRQEKSRPRHPSMRGILTRLQSEVALWAEYKYVGMPPPNVHQIGEWVCQYIADTVSFRLNVVTTGKEHLECVVDTIKDARIDCRGMATLSHDTHVKELLQDAGINTVSGFNAGGSWEDNWTENDGVPFLHLHGCVSWTRPDLVRPILLIGTSIKPALYVENALLDMHYRWRKCLHASDTLVVCGYSFGDEAVNGYIADWVRTDRTLVVIDRRSKTDVIGSCSPPAEDFLRRNKTIFVRRGLAQVQPSLLLERITGSRHP